MILRDRDTLKVQIFKKVLWVVANERIMQLLDISFMLGITFQGKLHILCSTVTNFFDIFACLMTVTKQFSKV